MTIVKTWLGQGDGAAGLSANATYVRSVKQAVESGFVLAADAPALTTEAAQSDVGK